MVCRVKACQVSVVAFLHGLGAMVTSSQLAPTWSNTIVDANATSPLNFEAVATHPPGRHRRAQPVRARRRRRTRGSRRRRVIGGAAEVDPIDAGEGVRYWLAARWFWERLRMVWRRRVCRRGRTSRPRRRRQRPAARQRRWRQSGRRDAASFWPTVWLVRRDCGVPHLCAGSWPDQVGWARLPAAVPVASGEWHRRDPSSRWGRVRRRWPCRWRWGSGRWVVWLSRW